jgi:hypothetical protein
MTAQKDIKQLFERRYESEKFRQPLREISKDASQGENQAVSLVDRDEVFYNYDEVVGDVFPQHRKPKSPDMAFFKDDTIYFVEFKNGQIEWRGGLRDESKCQDCGKWEECCQKWAECCIKREKWGIKLKALEGSFIVLHTIACKRLDKRVKFEDIFHLQKAYILVYNEKKNPTIKQQRKQDTQKKKNSLDYIHNRVYTDEIRFGLEILKGTFFKEVMTFTAAGFEDWMEREGLTNAATR